MKTKPIVTFSLECLEEDIPVRGNALASGNDALDTEAEDDILRRLDRGDLWAWCCVKVTASCGEFKGTSVVGGCSYQDEKDFRADLYPQMKDEALADLRATLKQAASRGRAAGKLAVRLAGKGFATRDD